MQTALDDGLRARLSDVRLHEDEAFGARIPTSLALSTAARGRMPSGVPMAWMAGLFRTPPLWISHAQGARFIDVDDHSYLDFNICDMSAVLGYAHPRLTEVIAEQAARGVQLMMPIESVLTVCDQLELRFGLPKWQFTLAASSANAEALRIARVATHRDGVLLFEGKYHGHLDETLWTAGQDGLDPESLGIGAAPDGLSVVGFNDLAAVERELRLERTAAVLAEGVLTNCGTVLPDAGFLDSVRDLCTRYGTLLIVDETHTQFDVYGGTVTQFGLRPDIVTGGKGIAGGVPIGVYGMTEDVAAVLEAHLEDDAKGVPGVAIGGTLFGNALSLACAAVVLSELMTPGEHQRIADLGQRLADGIEAAASLDPLFSDTRRVYFANRGVWDAISTSGPHLGFAHVDSDVDDYLNVLDDFLDDVM